MIMKTFLFRKFTLITRHWNQKPLSKILNLIRSKCVFLPIASIAMVLSMGLCPIKQSNSRLAYYWIKTIHPTSAKKCQNALPPFSKHCALLQKHHRAYFSVNRAKGKRDPFSEMTLIKSLGAIRSGAL